MLQGLGAAEGNIQLSMERLNVERQIRYDHTVIFSNFQLSSGHQLCDTPTLSSNWLAHSWVPLSAAEGGQGQFIGYI